MLPEVGWKLEAAQLPVVQSLVEVQLPVVAASSAEPMVPSVE